MATNNNRKKAAKVVPSIEITKKNLTKQLKNHARVITFQKLDGSMRTMNASLTYADTPSDVVQVRDPDQIKVYDNDANDWRTIVISNIKSIDLA